MAKMEWSPHPPARAPGWLGGRMPVHDWHLHVHEDGVELAGLAALEALDRQLLPFSTISTVAPSISSRSVRMPALRKLSSAAKSACRRAPGPDRRLPRHPRRARPRSCAAAWRKKGLVRTAEQGGSATSSSLSKACSSMNRSGVSARSPAGRRPHARRHRRATGRRRASRHSRRGLAAQLAGRIARFAAPSTSTPVPSMNSAMAFCAAGEASATSMPLMPARSQKYPAACSSGDAQLQIDPEQRPLPHFRFPPRWYRP